MPDLGPSRCIIALVSVGDTSGLRFQCPSRCTGVQIKVNNTSGWANIDYFRCIAKDCQNKIHRNSRFSSNSGVSPRIYHVISKQSFNIRTPAVHFSYRIPQQDRKERNLQEHPLFQPLYCARVCQLNRTYCPQG